MRMSSFLFVATMTGVMSVAPGMVRMSAAEGSAFEQRKAAQEERDFKAFSVQGMDSTPELATATVASGGKTKMWPGVPGVAPPEPIVPWISKDVMPRGGREY